MAKAPPDAGPAEYGPSLRDYPSESQLAAAARRGIKRRNLKPLIHYLRSPYAMELEWAADLAAMLEEITEIRFRKRGRPKSHDSITALFEAQTVADFYAEQIASGLNSKRALHATELEFHRGKTWVEERLALAKSATEAAGVAQGIESGRKRYLAKIELKRMLEEKPRPLRAARLREK